MRLSGTRAQILGSVMGLTLVGAMFTAIPLTAYAAAAPGVIPAGAWVDEFDTTTLDPAWSITNESVGNWSLTSTPGSLHLAAQPGDTYQAINTAKNVFMVDIPAGDFTAVTKVTSPVSKNFQGAGLIAWKDMDNYVRTGLVNVSFAPGGPRVIETDLETKAAFSAQTAPRPGTASELLKLDRVGNILTSSYWDNGAWVTASSVTASFDMTQVGVWALAAQDGTSQSADFDYFAVKATTGLSVIPAAAFTLEAKSGPSRYLTTNGTNLLMTPDRPLTTVALLAEQVGTTPGTMRLKDTATGEYVAVRAGRLVMAQIAGQAAQVQLLDAGGGSAFLVADGQYIGLAGGNLVTVEQTKAMKLLVRPMVTSGNALDVDAAGPTKKISKDQYGIFYEDINRAADGGLYAELVQNRSFEYAKADNASYTGLTSWSKSERGGAAGTIAVVNDEQRLNEMNRNYLKLDLTAPGSGEGSGVALTNSSYNTGLNIEAGKSYRFSAFARRSADNTRPLRIRLEDAGGTEVFGTGQIVAATDTWQKYEVTMAATGSTTAGRLAVVADGTGTVRLDMVSLFPTDTYRGRENGMRKDLAEKVAAMKPSFVRFPGGCVTNVGTFDAYGAPNYDRKRTYRWKETIGALEQRPTNYNFWGYNQSYGIGYLEYFQFAEDLGAKALPVVSVGVNGCGGPPPLTDDAKVAEWVQDTLDLIEFANGDASTTWGKKRADLGHPKPFHLQYIGLGNEEVQEQFFTNYPKFSAAIKAKYPDIMIISNSGQTSGGEHFDKMWDFARAQQADLVDEHYYNSPEWFLQNTHRYDTYDRTGPKVFLGEYASRGNTFYNALSEAAYMTGIERNSDVVNLASYAPLLANEDAVQWDPDAIWFNNHQAYGSANYYVQTLFSQNRGDVVLPSTLKAPTDPSPDISGGVFLSTWRTSAAYDDLKVTSLADNAVLFEDDFAAGASRWTPSSGSWNIVGGEYVQSDAGVEDARSTPPPADWSNYTMNVKARKIAGAEGFLVGFGMKATNKFYWWNLGGWNNTRSAIQKDGAEVAGSDTTIQTGKDYDVKIEVEGRTVKAYLDGQLVTTYTDTTTMEDLHQVVTRDDKTGDLLVKVVNSSESTIRTPVTITGAHGVLPHATVTEMTATSRTDKNTMSNPTKVVPVTRTVRGVSDSFTYDFPASSITFIRLSVRSQTTAP